MKTVGFLSLLPFDSWSVYFYSLSWQLFRLTNKKTQLALECRGLLLLWKSVIPLSSALTWQMFACWHINLSWWGWRSSAKRQRVSCHCEHVSTLMLAFSSKHRCVDTQPHRAARTHTPVSVIQSFIWKKENITEQPGKRNPGLCV